MAFTGSTGQHASGSGVIGGTNESNTWNVADGFTKIGVLKPLIEIALFERMMKFGKQDLEKNIPNDEIVRNRIEGARNLFFTMNQILSTCAFKIKKFEALKIPGIKKRIRQLEEKLPYGYKNYFNEITKERVIVIDDEYFDKLLRVASDIKEEIHQILDRAGMIFKIGDEIDIDDFIKSVYEG